MTRTSSPDDTPGAIALPDLEASSAAEVVGWALEQYHPQIALACSFQKEEAVLLDLLFEARPDARVFALDTGVLFDETYDLWRETGWNAPGPRRPSGRPSSATTPRSSAGPGRRWSSRRPSTARSCGSAIRRSAARSARSRRCARG